MMEKTREKEKLSEGPEDRTELAELGQISSFLDFAWR